MLLKLILDDIEKGIKITSFLEEKGFRLRHLDKDDKYNHLYYELVEEKREITLIKQDESSFLDELKKIINETKTFAEIYLVSEDKVRNKTAIFGSRESGIEIFAILPKGTTYTSKDKILIEMHLKNSSDTKLEVIKNRQRFFVIKFNDIGDRNILTLMPKPLSEPKKVTLLPNDEIVENAEIETEILKESTVYKLIIETLQISIKNTIKTLKTEPIEIRIV